MKITIGYSEGEIRKLLAERHGAHIDDVTVERTAGQERDGPYPGTPASVRFVVANPKTIDPLA